MARDIDGQTGAAPEAMQAMSVAAKRELSSWKSLRF